MIFSPSFINTLLIKVYDLNSIRRFVEVTLRIDVSKRS